MEVKKDLKFIFFALMAWGEGISGGDKISIELARRWSESFPVTIYLWEEGYRMYMRQNLNPKKIKFKIINMSPWKYFGFLVNYAARILAGILFSLKINLENEKNTIVYCATEFWMDSLPGFILKLRFPNITWITTWFQTAPNPLIGFKEGDRALSYRFHALPYWLVQLPIKHLIKKWADFVLVNNEFEKKQFPDMERQKKVIVVLGAVNFKEIENWKLKMSKARAGAPGNLPKVYDGVFQGRFHPQKGVVELIDIWKLVVDKKPDARLALIGDGPLMEEVKEEIKKLNLQENITLFGYIFDGVEKYQIFAQSKVVLHPAFYDSGGMAAAEAMALGLPAVGFNLKSYESYYPKGMVKVKIGDLESFANKILELLSNEKLYKKISKEAIQLINYQWSWEYRSREILDQVLEYPSI